MFLKFDQLEKDHIYKVIDPANIDLYLPLEQKFLFVKSLPNHKNKAIVCNALICGEMFFAQLQCLRN